MSMPRSSHTHEIDWRAFFFSRFFFGSFHFSVCVSVNVVAGDKVLGIHHIHDWLKEHTPPQNLLLFIIMNFNSSWGILHLRVKFYFHVAFHRQLPLQCDLRAY